MIVSIDIGTTYSSMCMLDPDGRPVPVAIGEDGTGWGSKYSLPTAVFVEENGKVLVGQAAMRSRMKNPSCFCMEFKRNLGENEPKLIGSRSFKIEELYTEVFLHMKNCLKNLSQEQIERVYLTYPAAYGKEKKERLLASAKAAGFLHVELVDEPGAAAMSYCAAGYVKEGQTVLVYDFGGGTFDAALVKYEDGTFRMLGEPAGLPRCGGMDMDRLIAKDMLYAVDEEILTGMRKNAGNYMRFTSQISEKSIRTKHQLSSADTAVEYIPIGAWDSLDYELSRETFEQMIAPKVGDTIQLCTRLLESTDIKKEELSAVLLVGGTSRVPLVRQMVENFAKGVPVYSAPDLELAVVQGALSYSGMKEGDKAEEYFQKGKEMWKDASLIEVAKWYRKAAEQGHAEAQMELGNCYNNGDGIEKNKTEAAKWYRKAMEQYRKAAEQGHAEAQKMLAFFYVNGLGVEKNETEAVKWYRKAMEQYRKAAEQGEILAQINLGDCYYYGHGVEINYTEAVKWYRKAAEQGHAETQKMLGSCYYYGHGVEKNYTEAVKWYRKAAEQGNAEAQKMLGNCYCIGHGVEINYTEAVKWYRKAAEQGEIVAQEMLGDCYKYGWGVEKNETEAAKWFRKSEEEERKKAEWYRKAVEQSENPRLKTCVGSNYYNGWGVEKNYVEAVKWYRKAAEQGEILAQIELGDCYYNGHGVEKNYTEAVKWYRKAAEQGAEYARKKLEELGIS